MKEFIGVGLFAAGLTISSLVGYFKGDAALTGRVVALETTKAETNRRLDAIERKLDILLDRTPAFPVR